MGRGGRIGAGHLAVPGPLGDGVRVSGLRVPSYTSVPVDGGELTVAVWGDLSDGAPVLAVHGITASSMAWIETATRLPGPVVAPDLRGRGGSGTLSGPYGMASHARDCITVLDALGIDRARVAGHSMGGFVAAVLAHRRPERVARLVLVDGGAPLPAPPGGPETVLGPAARRLRMRFPSREAYRDHWRAHPAFAGWTPAAEAYVDYDLTGAEGGFRSRASEEAMAADFVDLHSGAAPREAYEALPPGTPFLRAERGLLDETPPLYPDPSALAKLDVTTVAGTNHYSILFADAGAKAVAAALA
ncbi:Tropinesterase [Actinomadura madurae]|nr:Tropinesterase [Actinomadura madurae]